MSMLRSLVFHSAGQYVQVAHFPTTLDHAVGEGTWKGFGCLLLVIARSATDADVPTGKCTGSSG